MNDYNVTDYKIFENAISTTNKYVEAVNNSEEVAKEVKTTISNESIFMGPIQQNCVTEFGALDADLNSIHTNIVSISTFMTTTSTNYQTGDKEASNTITNTDTTNTAATTSTTQTSGVSSDGTTYTNSKSGATYKLYDQGVGDWANYQYSDGKDMAYRGCMLTAAASISSAANTSVNPGTLFKEHRHDYVASSVPAESNGKIKSQSISIDGNTNNNIVQNLQQGNSAIIMVKGRNDGGSSKFTSGQHYMALLDISDDGKKIFVGNSHVNDGGKYSANGWYPTEEVLESIREATVFTTT